MRQLDCRAVFAAAVGVVADLTARLQRRVGSSAVGDNKECRAVAGGGVVIDLAVNLELCICAQIDGCGCAGIVADDSFLFQHSRSAVI